MRLEHLAIYTGDLERMRDFYLRWFDATCNERYRSKSGMESYFLSFGDGARLELMWLPSLAPAVDMSARVGLTHLAFDCGSKERVASLTEEMRQAGVTVLSEPRTTGDGYFESCVADPDGNRVEITA